MAHKQKNNNLKKNDKNVASISAAWWQLLSTTGKI
jgi:hypothetical protein